jgi:hypothetical protein
MRYPARMNPYQAPRQDPAEDERGRGPGRRPAARPKWRVVISLALAVCSVVLLFKSGVGMAALCIVASLLVVGRRPKSPPRR